MNSKKQSISLIEKQPKIFQFKKEVSPVKKKRDKKKKDKEKGDVQKSLFVDEKVEKEEEVVVITDDTLLVPLEKPHPNTIYNGQLLSEEPQWSLK